VAREARRDPMFLTEVCERFKKEIAELGFSHDLEDMDRMFVMARRYFQLMVLTAEAMAKDAVSEKPTASCGAVHMGQGQAISIDDRGSARVAMGEGNGAEASDPA
jgi:hypothetical protein